MIGYQMSRLYCRWR